MSALIDQFRRSTAVYPWDLSGDPHYSIPVAVNYCSIDASLLRSYTKSKVDEGSDKNQDSETYIEKASEQIKRVIDESSFFIGEKAEEFYILSVEVIRTKIKDITTTGKTYGALIELSLAAGIGGVAGLLVGADKTGVSVLGYVGGSAGISFGGSGVLGVFEFPELRQSLEGWGGAFNASMVLPVGGVQWESMMTGGAAGNMGAVGIGLELSLSVEFQHAWLVKDIPINW